MTSWFPLETASVFRTVLFSMITCRQDEARQQLTRNNETLTAAVGSATRKDTRAHWFDLWLDLELLQMSTQKQVSQSGKVEGVEL